jgi:ankyrin repeat protein
MEENVTGEIIVEAGRHNVNVKDVNDKTLLFKTIGRPSFMEEEPEQLMKLLLTRDEIDVNVKNKYGRTPLICAVISEATSAVKLLLQRKDIDLEMKDKSDQTAFAYVMKYGMESMMYLFLKRNGIM